LEIDIGPIVDLKQLQHVESLVEGAKAAGATVLIGGRRASNLKGFYYEPTVLTNVNPTMAIMNEECFGPVLPIVVVDNIDEAVKQANASEYGLGASIWTADRQVGEDVARQLAVGMVWVNDVNVAFAEAPWGGYKSSGIGFELSPDALLEFTRRKHINVETSTDVRRFWWYPYS
jgi:acyl-CoA reductase-like NAD-dependent aldehyde dehydrogenase